MKAAISKRPTKNRRRSRQRAKEQTGKICLCVTARVIYIYIYIIMLSVSKPGFNVGPNTVVWFFGKTAQTQMINSSYRANTTTAG